MLSEKEKTQLAKRFIQHIEEGNVDAAYALTSDVYLRKQLKNLVVNKGMYGIEGIDLSKLSFDIYAMDIDSINVIIDHIRTYKPMKILELGSGCSSIIIGQVIKKLMVSDKKYRPDYYSIDDSESHISKYKEIAVQSEITGIVHFVSVSTKWVSNGLWFSKYYNLDDLWVQSDLKDIDLLIVDGPIGIPGKKIRRPAYYQIKDRLAKDFSIFLDDTSRPDEKLAAKEWGNRIPTSSVHFYENLARVSNLHLSSE